MQHLEKTIQDLACEEAEIALAQAKLRRSVKQLGNTPKFKIGDTVMLKSEGPVMTVTGIHSKDGDVGCEWFISESNSYGAIEFHPDALDHCATDRSTS